MKKTTKKSISQRLLIRNKLKMMGGINLLGKIGAGKSTGMMSFSEKLMANGYKIIDLWGGERSEGWFWGLPSPYASYFSHLKKKFKFNDACEPKQFKVRYLIPMSRKVPKELPEKSPDVFSHVFTIPFKDVTMEDFSLVRGTLTQSEEYTWRDTIEDATSSSGPFELDNLCKKNKCNKTILYKNVIKPFIREGLLQSEDCEFNLNILEEFKDRDTISVLILDYLPEEFHFFIVGWITRKLRIHLDARELPTKNILIMREVSKIFQVDDQSSAPDRLKILKKKIKDIIRMGRRGTHPFMDTQSISESRSLLGGSEDFMVLGRIPTTALADRRILDEIYMKPGFISSRQDNDLSEIEPGQYLLIPNSQKAQTIYLTIPRCMFWKFFGSMEKSI